MTATAFAPDLDDESARQVQASPALAELYDGDRCVFNVGRLRQAMVMRGLGINDLARRAKVGRTTIVTALRGDRIGWSASKIVRALAKTPLLLAD